MLEAYFTIGPTLLYLLYYRAYFTLPKQTNNIFVLARACIYKGLHIIFMLNHFMHDLGVREQLRRGIAAFAIFHTHGIWA